MVEPVSITALAGIPEIFSGDDISDVLFCALEANGMVLSNGDIICLAHKIISKAEGNLIELADVNPSPRAKKLAEDLNKDARKIEVILGESSEILRSFKHSEQNEGVMICEHRLGFISANAAVDESNCGSDGTVITLPRDPDFSARQIRKAIAERYQVDVGIIVTDTFGRPWRLGQVNVAIGLAGIPATRSEAGELDGWSRPLKVTEPAFADELAATTGLVMQKSARTPIVILKGVEWSPCESKAADILRKKKEDMFR